MDECVHELSKALLSNDPYHVPGYTGHCPGLRFSMGKPYGKLTAEVLCQKKKHPESDPTRLPVNIPDDVLRKTISGYSGFIPRSKNYFGCNYSETCRKAMTEVYLERLQQRSVHLPAITSCSSQHPNRPKPPLMAISDNVFLYKPLKPFMPPGNPYQMDDDDPHKYFVSGYSGHVPLSHSLFGKGFSITTNQALIEYGRQQRRLKSQDRDTKTCLPTLYSSHRGVVPGFSGHLPGLCLQHTPHGKTLRPAT